MERREQGDVLGSKPPVAKGAQLMRRWWEGGRPGKIPVPTHGNLGVHRFSSFRPRDCLYPCVFVLLNHTKML